MTWYAVAMSWLDFNALLLAASLCVRLEDWESTATYLPGGAVETTAGATASAGFFVSEIADRVHGSRAHRLSHPDFAGDGERSERNGGESECADNQNFHFQYSSSAIREGNHGASSAARQF
jgi:hypothetical protein